LARGCKTLGAFLGKNDEVERAYLGNNYLGNEVEAMVKKKRGKMLEKIVISY
jgi:hypothetical protein